MDITRKGKRKLFHYEILKCDGTTDLRTMCSVELPLDEIQLLVRDESIELVPREYYEHQPWADDCEVYCGGEARFKVPRKNLHFKDFGNGFWIPGDCVRITNSRQKERAL